MRDATEPSPVAAQLARMPQVVEVLLAAHVPDARSRCRGCGLPGTGSAHLAWPCSLWLVADTARRLLATRH
ncbi:hypothetical protein [Pseudonocardia adelaidensis]|uniref:Uncharacterized protein n=1 Tax=Pseudonocardia adelaidensis TaxID=648754 RepID=A0ABP9NDW7_9PSEU